MGCVETYRTEDNAPEMDEINSCCKKPSKKGVNADSSKVIECYNSDEEPDELVGKYVDVFFNDNSCYVGRVAQAVYGALNYAQRDLLSQHQHELYISNKQLEDSPLWTSSSLIHRNRRLNRKRKWKATSEQDQHDALDTEKRTKDSTSSTMHYSQSVLDDSTTDLDPAIMVDDGEILDILQICSNYPDLSRLHLNVKYADGERKLYHWPQKSNFVFSCEKESLEQKQLL